MEMVVVSCRVAIFRGGKVGFNGGVEDIKPVFDVYNMINSIQCNTDVRARLRILDKLMFKVTTTLARWDSMESS